MRGSARAYDRRMGQATRRRTFDFAVVTLVASVGLVAFSIVHADDAAPKAPQGDSAMVNVRVVQSDGTLAAPQPLPKFVLTDAEWRKRLTPDQYKITRNSGTEPAFCGGLLKNHEQGVYACICCGLPLFKSDAKFESGTGWPSFYQPAVPENVAEKVDRSYGMSRTEINCARCDAHLGHVFDDGPKPTGLRYCLNSDALKFVKDADLKTLAGIDGNATTQPAEAR